MIPAKSRRPRMPRILRTATPTIAAAASARAPAVVGAVVERRQDHAVGDLADHVGAGHGHAAVEAAAARRRGRTCPAAPGCPDRCAGARAAGRGLGGGTRGSSLFVGSVGRLDATRSLGLLTELRRTGGSRAVTSVGEHGFPAPRRPRARAPSPTCWRSSARTPPRCCEGWTTAHLAAHLVVRDRRPDAMAGYAIEAPGHGGPPRRLGAPAEDHLRTTTPYAEVVDRVRVGPAAVAADGLAAGRPGDQHDRVRHPPRGRPPRPAGLDAARRCSPADQDALWSAAALYARRGAGRRGVVLRRTDGAGDERRIGGEPAAPSRASRWSCCSGWPAAGTSPASTVS